MSRYIESIDQRKTMKYIHLLAVIIATSALWFIIYKNETISCASPGKVIVITGVSSSGKTSFSNALQEVYAEHKIPFFLIHSDEFLQHLPRQWVNFNPNVDPASMNPDGITYEKIKTAEGIKTITHSGALINTMRKATADVIKALACNKINVIYEGVIEAESLKKGIEQLKPLHVDVIFVTAPLDVIEQREKNREGMIGLGRSQMNEPGFFDEKLYNFTVDSSTMNPRQAAEYVYNQLNKN